MQKAGTYDVPIQQSALSTSTSMDSSDTETQRINVLTPRFTLPPDSIHSTFPADGASAPVTCLPHVVLNDAALLWEYAASIESTALLNRVPWLICLTFELEELRLTEAALNGPKSIFPAPSNPSEKRMQSPTMAVEINIDDMLRINSSQAIAPVLRHVGTDDTTEPKTSVIAIPGALFTSLVTAYDLNGAPKQGQQFCDPSRYALLAHVRRDRESKSSTRSEMSDRDLGIVISHRTGPPNCKAPSMLVSHLLSIEGVAGMPYPLDPEKRVILPSLYSWAHWCVPCENDSRSMDHLGNESGMLRRALPDGTMPAEMIQRLKDGYSMVRLRTITGEETAAFTRGPLAPVAVEYTLENTQANYGSSLQRLDEKLGLVDISYSAAWDLGRSLAIADPAFTAALSRLRRRILQPQTQRMRERESSLDDLMQRLGKMPGVADLPSRNRWKPSDDIKDSTLSTQLDHTASHSITDEAGEERDILPESEDWTTVRQFVFNLLSLRPVPAHYLLTDPSALPQESLRFFHVDRNWTHALIDGALSLANHVERDFDRARDILHKAIQQYARTQHGESKVPAYGFLLRSTVVEQSPDMNVTIESATETPTCAVVRHEVIGPGILLCLLSEPPSSDSYRVTFTQPGYQRSFSVGERLDENQVTISFKPGDGSVPDSDEPTRTYRWTRTKQHDSSPDTLSGPGVVYLWGTEPGLEDTRTLLVDNLAASLYASVQDNRKAATAGGVAIQLSISRKQQLTVYPPNS
ncbi:hypothetical protein BJY04DRAFT_192759 [Aspergillus karnatakaensis]|uniref:uncharacterized protein n=1 Tax=Aspergillus karnatakaensis TaxID=1810916 RepID=UPI003CCD3F93